MKKLFLFAVMVLMAIITHAATYVNDMKVENLRYPLGIDVAKPRFSWQLQSDDRGCVQTSYQIVVIDEAGNTVWDSGIVESALQNGIEYEGSDLQSRTAYQWAVSITDNNGNKAEGTATFETAFMNASQWTAKWIHADGASYQTLDPLTIELSSPVTCRYVRLNVSELGARANGDSGYSFVQLTEMEIYSEGDNVARSANFSVGKSADNWELPNYGWSLSYINDGKTGKQSALGWTTTQNVAVPVILTADLGSVKTVDRIVIYPRQDDHAVGNSNAAANFPASFTIQTSSDNKSYDVVYSKVAEKASTVPYFGKSFIIDNGKTVKRARIYASALGIFTMKLNGQPVTYSVLEPGESEYEKTILYSTYDVTYLLREGNNSLVAQVAGGIYNIDYLAGRFSKGEVQNNGDTGLIAELYIEYTDGTTENIVTDTTWKTTASPTTGSNWWGGEDFDARMKIADIESPDVDMSSWKDVTTITPYFSSPHSGVKGTGTLRSRMYEPLQVVEEWQAVSVKTIKSGGYTLRMVDFGRNFAGTYKFRLKGKAGQEISLRSGENINPDGSVLMENFYTGPSDTYDVYTFAGDADGEEWGPEFMYHGFRYLQIIGLDEEPKPEDFTAYRIRSAMDNVGSVETSNQLINDIHVICRDAIASQLYNSVTDCPHREKLGWLDVPNEMYVSLNMNFDMQNFYKKVVLDCFDAQQSNGWVPSVCPFYMNVYGDDTNWGGAAILVPYRNWKFYGDKSLMTRYYSQMKRLVQHFTDNTTGYLINNNYSVLSDWGQQTAGVSPLIPTEFTETTTYYYILKAMEEMATELGRASDATNYRTRAANVKNAFNTKFYNAETGVYTSVSGGGGRQSEQAQPLYYGLVPDGDEQKVADVLAQAVKNDGYKIKTGEIALKCVFMSLAKYGYNDIVWQMANQTDCPSYGYWVKEGYTTTPEYWDVGDLSQNHCMMDHIEEWFFTQLGGIQNTGTAFDTFKIEPFMPDDLPQSDISTACQYGTIRSAWTRNGDDTEFIFEVPAGTQATIIIPVAEGKSLYDNRSLLEAGKDGIISVNYADGKATIVAGSGNYKLTTAEPPAIITSGNWMQRLPDDTFICMVSIPGAHDAATGSGWAAGNESMGNSFAKTQDITIPEQWSIGVRAFDLRPCVYEDYMNINHGIMPTRLHFEDVLCMLRDSLIANPSEFVVIHLLHASDGDQVENAYNSRLTQILKRDDLKDYFVTFKAGMKVKDARGKILILSRDNYSTAPIGGIFQNWTGESNWTKQIQCRITAGGGVSVKCYVQDYSDTHNDGGLDTKIAAITKMLDVSTTHTTRSRQSEIWFLNFASAYSKVLSLLGYEISTSEGYRDNAAHTHATFLDYLNNPDYKPGPTGIVLMDYVGVDTSEGYEVKGSQLVDAIIENNFKYIQDVTSVNNITDNQLSEVYYNLSGLSSSIPQKGVNIVRRSDGKVEKVLMR